MKKSLIKEIIIPSGVEVKIKDNEITTKGPLGELKKEFKLGKMEFVKGAEKLSLKVEKATKRDKRELNTITAHITNMIQGVQEKFEYKLKICYGHFPFTVKIEDKKAIIKNFLGEKVQREAIIPNNAEVEMQKEYIIIKALDKEIAGQAAANLETATKIKGRDRRRFQDGIYIINKCGKEI
jgi:large subunit ribosomal protein L6